MKQPQLRDEAAAVLRERKRERAVLASFKLNNR